MPEEGGGRAPAHLRPALNWALVYASWAVCIALTVVDILAWRRALTLLHIALGGGRWWLGAVDKWGLFVLGILGLVWILHIQYYLTEGYPGGTELGTFPRRLLRVVAAQVGALVPAAAVMTFV